MVQWIITLIAPVESIELFLILSQPVLHNFCNKKEGNVLFNDALNTFYSTVIWRRTYGKGQLR